MLEEAGCRTSTGLFVRQLEASINTILIKMLHRYACTYHSLLGILAEMIEATATCLC